jgi:long-chain acyl-CoA synthetase
MQRKNPGLSRRKAMHETKPLLLLDAAYQQEKNNPERVYMTQPVGGGKVIDYTWREAMEQARRMAAYLRSLHLPENSNIAMISKNCAHFIICDLAIWMAGHATVALYPTLTAETVQWILEHSESRLIFVGKLDDWDDMKDGVPEDLPKVALPLAPATDFPQWDEIIAGQQPIQDNPSPPGEQLALIAYTSGSTGQPKGVMHSFTSASVPAQHAVRQFDLGPQDRSLSYLPLAHIMERMIIECESFYSGAHIYFTETLDTFLQDLNRARPTAFVSVPRLWLKFQLSVFQKIPEQELERLLQIPEQRAAVGKQVLEGLGLGEAKFGISGSAPIPAELIEWYDKLGFPILEGYGMSEDFSYSHISTPQQRKPGYVGVAWPDVESRVSDEGEIQLRSPGNMLGYYKAPELTAQCYTEDGYFKTGDRGEYSPEGLLKITGRTKELFKTSKGKYVAPVPIENLLNADSHIEACCVSGVGRPACYAVIQLAEELRDRVGDQGFREELTPQLEALLDKVNSQVEGYERMQFLAVVTDEWQIANDFLTPTQKIKRNVIESAYSPFLDEWYASGKKLVWQS